MFAKKILQMLSVVVLGLTISQVPCVAQRPLFNKSLPAILEFDEAQLQKREELLSRYRSQLGDGFVGVEELEAHEQRLNAEFVACFRPEQLALYQKAITFRNSGGSVSIELIRRATFRDELKLTDAQKKSLNDIREKLKEDIAATRDSFAQQREERREQLQKDFFAIMRPAQVDKYKSHLGPEFDVKAAFGSLSSVRINLGDASASSFFSTSHFSPMLFFCLTAKSIDPELHAVSLFGVLENQAVMEELKLSEAQKEAVSKWGLQIKELLNDLSGAKFSANGEKLDTQEPSSQLSFNLLFAQNEDKLREVGQILHREQFARLKEIYRQVSIASGSPEGVFAFHFGWGAFLEISDEQSVKLRQIQEDYLVFDRTNPHEELAEVNEREEASFAAGFKVLDKTQQRIFADRMGPFVKLPERVVWVRGGTRGEFWLQKAREPGNEEAGAGHQVFPALDFVNMLRSPSPSGR